MERGDPLPPPPPPSINPDYVQCPYCSRRFNEKAAERHINFCKEQQSRLPNKPKGDPRAANKMATRLQYQPPKPKTRSPATGTDMMGSPGYSPAGGTSRAPPSRTPPSRTPAASKTPASRPGVGRTPQGASNGYGRQPATRGRSTTGYQASDHGDDLDTPGFEGSQGIILRTGRDGRAYNEAKKDIKNGMKNKSQYMRGVTKGLETSPSSNMMYSGHLRDNESDYYSGGSDNEYHNINAHALSVMNHDHFGAPSHASAGAKFCHECGTKYPPATHRAQTPVATVRTTMVPVPVATTATCVPVPLTDGVVSPPHLPGYNCYGDVTSLHPSGRHSGGVAASQNEVKYDISTLNAHKSCYVTAGRNNCIHPALIAALASRESHAGRLLHSTNGWGDNHHAYGVLQCDVRYCPVCSHGLKCTTYGWDSCQHIDMMTKYVLVPYIKQVQRKHPTWPAAHQMQGGVAAYNFGPGNVQSWGGLDIGSTGNDYSNDVIARAQYLISHEGW
ncbi:hypothetical protein FSP39_008858 [Pinctada imbricata]|uniref:C2HC/C3H-type domain-containing protein n=1 Tax=Pinctada imbricata TaxID=66713 RepID=A0AA88XLP0_PINIB|nr:hypothetical protein FSP39_008858 [Pinctada imbricata]